MIYVHLTTSCTDTSHGWISPAPESDLLRIEWLQALKDIDGEKSDAVNECSYNFLLSAEWIKPITMLLVAFCQKGGWLNRQDRERLNKILFISVFGRIQPQLPLEQVGLRQYQLTFFGNTLIDFKLEIPASQNILLK